MSHVYSFGEDLMKGAFKLISLIISVVKIGKKIGSHSSASISAYAPRARSVSLTRKKKHGCPEQAFYCKWSRIFTPAVT